MNTKQALDCIKNAPAYIYNGVNSRRAHSHHAGDKAADNSLAKTQPVNAFNPVKRRFADGFQRGGNTAAQRVNTKFQHFYNATAQRLPAKTLDNISGGLRDPFDCVGNMRNKRFDTACNTCNDGFS